MSALFSGGHDIALLVIYPALQLGTGRGRQEDTMYTLYSMHRSGNSYKVGLRLPSWASAPAGRDRYPPGRKPHARISRQESERPGAVARGGAGPLHREVERHPMVLASGTPLRAGAPSRPSRGPAMDVLRAALVSSPTSVPHISGWRWCGAGGTCSAALEDWMEESNRRAR